MAPGDFVSGKACRYYQAGYCWRGSSCAFAHRAAPPRTLVHHLPPKPAPGLALDDADLRPVPSASSQSPRPATQHVPLAPPERSPEDTCGICMELPSSYYGLLSSCSHIFCMRCIRAWRETKGKSTRQISLGMLRRCPLCRVESAYLVPSRTFHPDGPLKEAVIRLTRVKWSEQPCKNFKRYGDCSFGAECFYKHVTPAGQVVRLEHTHEEWLRNHNAQESEFPGSSLAARASLNGLNTMQMLARLLLHQPAVRDYLVNQTEAAPDDVDALLQRFANGEPLIRPLRLGRLLEERLARTEGALAPAPVVDLAVDNLPRGNEARHDVDNSESIVGHTDGHTEGAGGSGSGRSADAGLSAGNRSLAGDAVDQREAGRTEANQALGMVASEDLDESPRRHSGEGSSTLPGQPVTTAELDEIAEPSPTLATRNTTEGDTPTFPEITASSQMNETPEASSMATTRHVPEGGLRLVYEDPTHIAQSTSFGLPTQANNGTLDPSTEPQDTTSDLTEQAHPQAFQHVPPSLPVQPIAQPERPNPSPAEAAPRTAADPTHDISSLSQNVAPLARAILGPNLNRVADDAEEHMTMLLTDFLTPEEAAEAARLATRWLRGIIAAT